MIMLAPINQELLLLPVIPLLKLYSIINRFVLVYRAFLHALHIMIPNIIIVISLNRSQILYLC
jgi:hypothetical protein